MTEAPLPQPRLGWLCAALIGVAAPVAALALLVDPARPIAAQLLAGPVLALGMMGVGMIAAALVGRMGTGALAALFVAALLIALARALGMPPVASPFTAALALLVASLSFAARGSLFARSAGDRGWLIALFVVTGEAAMLITAAAMPGALPDWLLALLPAQWASVAIQTAFTGAGGAGVGVVSSVVLALGGTAATTLLVAALWPRRWPYAIMFTAWLAFSALVLNRPGPELPQAEISASPRSMSTTQSSSALPAGRR